MLPILYIEENRLFDISGQAYAVFKIDSSPYAYQPKHIQKQVIDRFTRGINGLIGEFWIYLLTKQYSISQILSDMRKESNHTIWQMHMREVEEHLRVFLPFNRVNLVVIPLNRKRITIELSTENWKEWFKQAASGVLDVKNKILRQNLILMDRLEAARKESEEWRTKLRVLGQVKSATLDEIEWWLKRSYFRGLQEPKNMFPSAFPAQIINRDAQSYLRPTRNVLLSLSDVLCQEQSTKLIFEHSDGQKSHQTFYSSVGVPQPIDEVDPTGFEWIYGVIEQLNFPVDVALHIRVEPHNAAHQHLQGKKKTAEEQMKEWEENNEEAPLELEEDLSTVKVLEKKLRARQSLVHTKVIFALGDSNPNELKDKEEDFKSRAGMYHILVRAPGDMKKMFQAFYPFGEDLPDTWETPMDPGVIGASVPLGSKTLGDPSGFRLGSLNTGRPVFMDPRRPAQVLNKPTAIMIAGTLGGGKTVTEKFIDVMLLTWNAKGFHIDPKGDTDPLAELPFNTKILRFTKESPTKFSPFCVGDVQDSRAIVELLFNPRGSEIRQIVLNMAVETVLADHEKDMYTFIKALCTIRDTHPELDYRSEARTVAELARQLESHELGRKFFGEDTGELFDADFVIAVVRGLTLPEKQPKKEEWSENERYSVAIMYAVATLGLTKLMAMPRKVLKFIAIDEAWVLRRFEQGRRLINDALRFSRSENLVPIIASQNTTDFLPKKESQEDEDITGLFSWKFMLHLESKIQVEGALKILGIDEDPENWMKKFADYCNGFGIVRDPEGRIGEMQVEVLPAALMEYLDSTPTS